MKRYSIAVTLAAALALGSMGAVAASSKAANQMNVRFPVSFTLFNPCTGELVDFSGTAHVVLVLTTNDNHGSLMFHANDQAVSGVGQTTGARYTEIANFSDHIEGSFVNGQLSQTTVIRNLRWVTAGGGNNWLDFDETDHITINANGDVTVDFVHAAVTGCG